MKTNFLLILLGFAVVCTVAFGFISFDPHVNPTEEQSDKNGSCAASDNESGPDFPFVYVVEPRFNSCVIQETLTSAERLDDIYAFNYYNDITEYLNITLSTFEESRSLEKKATSTGEYFSDEQLAMLNEFDYSTDFYITGNVMRTEFESGEVVRDTLVRYFSILPDKPVLYGDDMEELITYFRENSREEIQIAREAEIDPGKISFTVNEGGSLQDIALDVSCGYPSIDAKLLQLVTDLPEKWTPARNSKGELVKQELVLFFGSYGC